MQQERTVFQSAHHLILAKIKQKLCDNFKKAAFWKRNKYFNYRQLKILLNYVWLVVNARASSITVSVIVLKATRNNLLSPLKKNKNYVGTYHYQD